MDGIVIDAAATWFNNRRYRQMQVVRRLVDRRVTRVCGTVILWYGVQMMQSIESLYGNYFDAIF